MIPFWTERITHYKRMQAADGTVIWKRSVHSGCFWKKSETQQRTDGAQFKLAGIVCRIPAPYPDVRTGDIIVRGSVTDEIDEYTKGKRSADLLQRYAGECMIAAEVRRNKRGLGGTDHIYIGG